MTPPSPEDPKGIAGKQKDQLQLVPPVILREMAKALAVGADKYGPWNWRSQRVEIMTYIGAIHRHLASVIERDDIDDESGAHHLGHIAAGCAIILDAMKQGTLVDNRPPKRLEVGTENGEVLLPLEVLHVDGKPATWEDLLPGDVIEEVAQNLANAASVPAEMVDGKLQYSLTREYEEVDDEWDFERGWTNGEVVLWKGEIYRFHSGIAEDSPVKLCSVEPVVSSQWTHLGPVKK